MTQDRLDISLRGTFPASDPLPPGPRTAPLPPARCELHIGAPAPQLVLPTTDGALWSLFEQTPRNYTLLIAYRGWDSPLCRTYLGSLSRLERRFRSQGVQPVVLSSDSLDGAQRTKKHWGLEEVTVAYGMRRENAERWGLFVEGQGDSLVVQPGLFLVSRDHVLRYASIQSSPFGRPQLSTVAAALDDDSLMRLPD